MCRNSFFKNYCILGESDGNQYIAKKLGDYLRTIDLEEVLSDVALLDNAIDLSFLSCTAVGRIDDVDASDNDEYHKNVRQSGAPKVRFLTTSIISMRSRSFSILTS